MPLQSPKKVHQRYGYRSGQSVKIIQNGPTNLKTSLFRLYKENQIFPNEFLNGEYPPTLVSIGAPLMMPLLISFHYVSMDDSLPLVVFRPKLIW
jgi:hypothetical protein